MKITITYTARKGLANYSYEEMVGVADCGSYADICKLKSEVDDALADKTEVIGPVSGTIQDVEKVSIPETVSTEAVKKPTPKVKAAKKEVVAPAVGAELVPKVEKSVKSDIEKYSGEAHKGTLVAHLTKIMGDAWKAHPDLKKLSPSLEGSDFRDTKTGLIVDSFKDKVSDFFKVDLSSDVL